MGPMFFTGKPIQNYKFTRFCIGFPVKKLWLCHSVSESVSDVFGRLNKSYNSFNFQVTTSRFCMHGYRSKWYLNGDDDEENPKWSYLGNFANYNIQILRGNISKFYLQDYGNNVDDDDDNDYDDTNQNGHKWAILCIRISRFHRKIGLDSNYSWRHSFQCIYDF